VKTAVLLSVRLRPVLSALW